MKLILVLKSALQSRDKWYGDKAKSQDLGLVRSKSVLKFGKNTTFVTGDAERDVYYCLETEIPSSSESINCYSQRAENLPKL